jgi:hypothetical protein
MNKCRSILFLSSGIQNWQYENCLEMSVSVCVHTSVFVCVCVCIYIYMYTDSRGPSSVTLHGRPGVAEESSSHMSDVYANL